MRNVQSICFLAFLLVVGVSADADGFLPSTREESDGGVEGLVSDEIKKEVIADVRRLGMYPDLNQFERELSNDEDWKSKFSTPSSSSSTSTGSKNSGINNNNNNNKDKGYSAGAAAANVATAGIVLGSDNKAAAIVGTGLGAALAPQGNKSAGALFGSILGTLFGRIFSSKKEEKKTPTRTVVYHAYDKDSDDKHKGYSFNDRRNDDIDDYYRRRQYSKGYVERMSRSLSNGRSKNVPFRGQRDEKRDILFEFSTLFGSEPVSTGIQYPTTARMRASRTDLLELAKECRLNKADIKWDEVGTVDFFFGGIRMRRNDFLYNLIDLAEKSNKGRAKIEVLLIPKRVTRFRSGNRSGNALSTAIKEQESAKRRLENAQENVYKEMKYVLRNRDTRNLRQKDITKALLMELYAKAGNEQNARKLNDWKTLIAPLEEEVNDLNDVVARLKQFK